MFLAASVLILVSILIGALIEAVERAHVIFTAEALLLFFLASVVCTALAASNQLTAQMAALFVNLFFLHRIPILYFSPELLDYPIYLGDSQKIIEAAAFDFLLCVAFLGLGISFVGLFRNYNPQHRNQMRRALITDPVRLLSLRADWGTLVRVSVPICLVLLIIQGFSLIYLDIGITGAVGSSNEFNTLLAITEMAKFILPVAIIGYLISTESGDLLLKKRSKTLLFLIILSLILIASRGAFFFMAISFYVGMRFLGLKNQNKYIRLIFILLLLSVITFPLITYSRYLLLDIDVPLLHFFNHFAFFRDISARLGAGVESYFLWFKYLSDGPQEKLPELYTLVFDAVNSLVPGEIINYDAGINYTKLQTYIGRPDQVGYQSVAYLEQVGGHGETPGTYGMAFILFGSLSFISFFFAGLLCAFLESSRISSFWKFYWTPYLLSTPWLVPSSGLIHQTIIIIALIIYCMQFRTNRASAIAIRRGIETPSMPRAGHSSATTGFET